MTNVTKEKNVEEINHPTAAKAMGVSVDVARQIRCRGLFGAEHQGIWTPREIVAVAVRVAARRAGATKAASDAAFRILMAADQDELRKSCADGKQHLRLLGDVCDSNLVTAQAAFDPKVMAKATKHRLAHVIVDVGYWVGRVDSVCTSTKTLAGEKVKNET